ncbi:polyprenyl synthetase family protein [Rhodovulum sulfidophilum]|uniref:polyprenyl synthetase family protein n=1 Tax=Rhodovulum sulfidophilum TaxID=35806 RepID=UPI001922DF71|nr:polyprenyl synthetase family protein [Rhodovulum sulfidophilum]MBL3596354.1 polyprenyl synthetase family protein [Rhodovulum sulfidophilum]
MLAAVASSQQGFEDVTRWLIGAGGKRLRPILLLLTARGLIDEADRETAITAAAAVEMIHVASLYHDDVMDRAELRRSTESVNHRWSSPIASFAGTFVLARAITMLDAISPEASALAGEHCAALCLGQLREAENAFNPDWTIEEHLEMLEGKTAGLFILAASLGALLGNVSDRDRDALIAYGKYLGLAFQLRDDVLDYTSSSAELGKGSASDLREGAYTLPVLLCLSQDGAGSRELRALLRLAHIRDADIARGVDIVRASGAVEATAKLAREKSAAAVKTIAGLGDRVLRDSLANLARISVERMA